MALAGGVSVRDWLAADMYHPSVSQVVKHQSSQLCRMLHALMRLQRRLVASVHGVVRSLARRVSSMLRLALPPSATAQPPLTTGGTPLAVFFGPATPFVAPVSERLRTEWKCEIASDDPDEMALQARTASVLVGGLEKANQLMRLSGPALRLMQCHFAGIDWLDSAARPAHVPVCNASGMEFAIAEWVLAAMLQLTVRLHDIDRDMRKRCVEAAAHGTDGGFAPPFFAAPLAPLRPELSNKTVGIVGYGKIGATIARRAAAFGCTVIGTVGRDVPPPTPPDLAWLDGNGGLSRLLEVSDYVVLACPLTKRTAGLIGKEQLARMKTTAVLINIARGQVVDEAALYHALVEGAIGAAAIDVWWRLPDISKGHRECSSYDLASHPFHTLPNVIMSNHTSGWSDLQLERRYEVVAGNLDRLVRGEPLQSVVVPANRGATAT